MRSFFVKLTTWIRGHMFILALAIAGLAAVIAVAWFAVDMTRPPDLADHGHQSYVEAQQRLHVQESRAHLGVLANALAAAGRPPDDLAARAQRVHADLEWAIEPTGVLAEAWPDIAAELERLVEQIRSGDPVASETLERVRTLVARSGAGL